MGGARPGQGKTLQLAGMAGKLVFPSSYLQTGLIQLTEVLRYGHLRCPEQGLQKT